MNVNFTKAEQDQLEYLATRQGMSLAVFVKDRMLQLLYENDPAAQEIPQQAPVPELADLTWAFEDYVKAKRLQRLAARSAKQLPESRTKSYAIYQPAERRTK